MSFWALFRPALSSQITPTASSPPIQALVGLNSASPRRSPARPAGLTAETDGFPQTGISHGVGRGAEKRPRRTNFAKRPGVRVASATALVAGPVDTGDVPLARRDSKIQPSRHQQRAILICSSTAQGSGQKRQLTLRALQDAPAPHVGSVPSFGQSPASSDLRSSAPARPSPPDPEGGGVAPSDPILPQRISNHRDRHGEVRITDCP